MTSELGTDLHQPDHKPEEPQTGAPVSAGSAEHVDISGLFDQPNRVGTRQPARPLSKAERRAAEEAERKMTQKRLPLRGVVAIATAAAAVATGIGVAVGMNASSRGGEGRDVPSAGGPVTAGGGETASSSASATAPETARTVDGKEGYKGPIPLEQLVVHESTKTFEELDKITDIEAFAKESPANRALWGHNFVANAITDNTAGVDTNNHDVNSFDDANFTGGQKTLLNIHNIYAHIGQMNETQVRKLVLSLNYDPLDPATGKLSDQMKDILDIYAAQSSGRSGDTPVPYARDETAWTLTPDIYGNKEWMKAVYYQTKSTSDTEYGGDRTSQLVRMTVKDPSTSDIDVWSMYGNSRDGNAIDQLTSPIR